MAPTEGCGILRLQARAKMNWTLDVERKREDGFHDLDMLLQSVELHDTLTIEPAQALHMAVVRGRHMRANENNLVMKAARALQNATGATAGARIALEKRIPVGAGMGGGSADAAAVLVGLNQLWGLGLQSGELEVIGRDIGADVPFCVRGGLQRASGTGEVLTPLHAKRRFWLVVIQPCRGLSTRDVFTALHVPQIAAETRPNNAAAAQALERGDVEMLVCAMGNVLEPVATVLRPEIALCIARLQGQDALAAQMTGSGSAVFGVYATAKQARGALDALRDTYRAIWMTSTAQSGVVLEKT